MFQVNYSEQQSTDPHGLLFTLAADLLQLDLRNHCLKSVCTLLKLSDLCLVHAHRYLTADTIRSHESQCAQAALLNALLAMHHR